MQIEGDVLDLSLNLRGERGFPKAHGEDTREGEKAGKKGHIDGIQLHQATPMRATGE
jgi:hypothetical protein